MNQKYVEIGCTPASEDCAQISDADYAERSYFECSLFIEVLIKHFGEPPGRTKFRIKLSEHDFGIYREVACYYDPRSEDETKYAENAEANTPDKWPDWALEKLNKFLNENI